MPVKFIDKVATPKGYQIRRAMPGHLRAKRDGMFSLADQIDVKIAVEVGTQWGWWAYRAMKHGFKKDTVLYCVDTWLDDYKSRVHYKGGIENMYDWMLHVQPWLGTRVFGYLGDSVEVSKIFHKPIDFLFIDADHHTQAVLADLKAWYPKVRKGGLVVGHDWSGIWGKEVKPAVLEFFGRRENFEVDLIYYSASRKKNVSDCWYKFK